MNNDTEDDANYGLRYRVTAPLNPGDYFRIGIKANTDNFVRPANAGGFIAVSSVSWTTFDAQGGERF